MATQHHKHDNVVRVDFMENPKAWNLRGFVREHGIPRGTGIRCHGIVTSILKIGNDNAFVREVTHG